MDANVIMFEGSEWRILAKGATDDDGRTFHHLASTTEFVIQRNGRRPRQIAVWIAPTVKPAN